MEWLCVDTVLGDLAGHKDNSKGRLAYNRYIEGLVKKYRSKEGSKSFDGEWKPLRRGWYLGSEDFRSRLTKLLDKIMHGKQRGTYWGDERRTHDEARAGQLLQKGLQVLQRDMQDLKRSTKGTYEKQILAWWLRRNTVISRKWISEHLWMGDVSRVTKAISAVNSNRDDDIMRLKNRLERIS